MKCNESPSEAGPQTKSPRRQKYTKVLDHRKHPLRGLWRRNGSFVARISVEDTTGPKSVRWVPLAAKSVAGAQDEVRKLLVSSGQRQPGSIARPQSKHR